jgi:hypothetical protein
MNSMPEFVPLQHQQSQIGMASTMSGCTWHTVNGANTNSTSPSRHLVLSQHLPPPSPTSTGGNPLAGLAHQMQLAMMVENSGVGVDPAAASHMTEVLLNTVSGISTLRAAVGENVLAEFLGLLLKDGASSSSLTKGGNASSNSYLPVGLLDN